MKLVAVIVIILASFIYGQDSTGTVTDIDGNVYKTVKIGNQWWMAENLKVTHYRNGGQIPAVSDSLEWFGLSTGAYCVYDNTENNADTYGYLYNWYAVNDSLKLAPDGWHVPTDTEWQILVDYLGGSKIAGGKMKTNATDLWNVLMEGATNESGFSALPGGRRDIIKSAFVFGSRKGGFTYLGDSAFFWSSTEFYSNKYSNSAWHRTLYSSGTKVQRGNYEEIGGFSVRCVRD